MSLSLRSVVNILSYLKGTGMILPPCCCIFCCGLVWFVCSDNTRSLTTRPSGDSLYPLKHLAEFVHVSLNAIEGAH